jgi:general secretion pathway protein G
VGTVRGGGVRGGPAGRRAGGFTLIELLVVIAIIGIIVTVASGQYRRSIEKAKEAVLREDLYIMRTAISQYFADKGKYPSDLRALVDDSYLKAIPVDPITLSSESWVTQSSEADEKDISQEPGISDVKSGAPGTAVDGTSYSDW